jgi:hypothetical protein
MAVAAFIPVCLYLSIPILMHTLMLGANPLTSALSAGAGLAATGMGISAGGRLALDLNRGRHRLTRSGGRWRRRRNGCWSVSIGPSIAPRSEMLNPPSSASGGASAPSGGVSSAAPAVAPIGHQVMSTSGGGMSATQIDAGNFSVRTSSGASRNFKGNVAHAPTVQQAFNDMLSQSSEPPKPTAT